MMNFSYRSKPFSFLHLAIAVLTGFVFGAVIIAGVYGSRASGTREELLRAQEALSQRADYPPRASVEEKESCTVLTCANGMIFPTCACTDGACTPVSYFGDPCEER